MRLAANNRARRKLRCRFLKDKPGHPCPRLQQRQDEQRLEHDDKVVPVTHQLLQPRQAAKYLRHPHCQRHRAAHPPRQMLLRPRLQRRQLPRRQIPAVLRADGLHHGRMRGRIGIDRKVIARLQRARRHQGQHRHKPFHQHRAVPDHPDLGFAGNHLRRRARPDQCMKPGNGTAHDHDTHKRPDRSRDNRPVAMNEGRQHRHFQSRMRNQDPGAEHHHHANLHVRTQIIARTHQHPHRQTSRNKRVRWQQHG